MCASSLRGGHANLLCAVPSLTDDPLVTLYYVKRIAHGVRGPRQSVEAAVERRRQKLSVMRNYRDSQVACQDVGSRGRGEAARSDPAATPMPDLVMRHSVV